MTAKEHEHVYVCRYGWDVCERCGKHEVVFEVSP